MLITEGKITEFFFMADGFCRLFDATIEKYAITLLCFSAYKLAGKDFGTVPLGISGR